MVDRVIPFNDGKSKRSTLTIEATILSAAETALEDLKEIIYSDDIGIEKNDIHHRFSLLTGITLMIEVENHGFSELLVSKLRIIDKKALGLMDEVAEKS